MRLNYLTATLTALSLTGAAASAQTVGFGTTEPGSFTHSTGSAISKVVSEVTDIKARVQPGSTVSLHRIATGEVQFGLSNSFDTVFFATGTGDYEKQPPQPKMRLVANITPLRVGVFVRKDSDIKSLKELKGRNVPSGFTAQKTIGRIISAHLANAGLSYDDVKGNPAPNVVRAADDFATGKNDMLFFAVGSAKVLQVAAKVGGIRALPIDTSKEAVARMRKILPGSFPMPVKPGKQTPGIDEPIDIIAFDFLMSTTTDMSEEIVYTITKAIHDNKKKLVDAFRPLALFDPKNMVRVYDEIGYHPGAIKFYKEIGAWPPKG